VKRREHLRHDEDGFRVRPEERARHPAVRVRRLAEVRDVPLDARQVLEVGRGREEEKVDALGLHPLAEATPPLVVVEHHGSLSVTPGSVTRPIYG